MKVTLTSKGLEWATCLEHVPPITKMVKDEFTPVDPNAGWSIANEVVRLFSQAGGLLVESATTLCVAGKLAEWLDVPRAVLEEVLFELTELGYIQVFPIPEEQLVAWTVHMLRVVAHPSRAKIITSLRNDLATSKELCEFLGNVPIMTMRYHLDPLIKAGIVEKVKRERLEYTLMRPMLGAISRRFKRCLC